MHTFNWSPGIGDPTVGGWVTVILYFLAFVSSVRTARLVRLRERLAGNEKYLWRAMAFMFAALGINKQLDLQSALTELGRVAEDQQGWYDERQIVQIWFIVGVAVASISVVAILLILAWKAPVSTWFALMGTTIILAFVLIRAASFHHIDRFIGTTVLGLRWNWVLEMGGISIVIVASELRRRKLNASMDAPDEGAVADHPHYTDLARR
jgi:hypothetical protein